jgi:SagB-type dehydrogenase family enzyme
LRRDAEDGAKVLGAPRKVKLTEPRQDGSVALERCIRQRRSVRGFCDGALTKGELGQLLWAAQGVTGSGGERTVPSAGALYPLELYVAVRNVGSLAAAVYRYVVPRHELVLVASGYPPEKLTAAAGGQDWIVTAPAILCIAGAFERTTIKYGGRGRGYVYMEAGHAAESLMLQAVALSLATTMVGAFSDEEVGRIFRLRADETPLCLIPVGRP